jgi:hypothetical protein
MPESLPSAGMGDFLVYRVGMGRMTGNIPAWEWENGRKNFWYVRKFSSGGETTSFGAWKL